MVYVYIMHLGLGLVRPVRRVFFYKKRQVAVGIAGNLSSQRKISLMKIDDCLIENPLKFTVEFQFYGWFSYSQEKNMVACPWFSGEFSNKDPYLWWIYHDFIHLERSFNHSDLHKLEINPSSPPKMARSPNQTLNGQNHEIRVGSSSGCSWYSARCVQRRRSKTSFVLATGQSYSDSRELNGFIAVVYLRDYFSGYVYIYIYILYTLDITNWIYIYTSIYIHI